MGSKISNSEVKTPKEIEKEIERLEQNDYLNGNDLLYFFCQKYPIPPLEKVGETQEQLTSAEEHFADQMWLIGRTYAASPERYSYSKKKKKGKPKEDLLNDEGYESFFQDISRIILREECHQKEMPVAYFRGNRVDINKVINELASPNPDKSIWKDIVDPDNVNADNAKELDSWIGKQDESPAKNAAQDAAERLSSLFKNQRLFAQDKPEPLALDFVYSADCLDNEKGIERNILSIKDSAVCVSKFAAALSSARRLRDIACILETLIEVKARLVKTREKLGKDATGEKLYEEIFSKGDKKSWRKLPERACLVVKGEPSGSISFSSKFLHFHYPKTIFIYDSISAAKTKFSSKKNDSELTEVFSHFEDWRDDFWKNNKAPLERCIKMYESDYANLIAEDKKPKNKELDYLKHAREELIFAYFLLDHLLDNRSNNSARKRLITELRSSTTETQDDSHIPSHCTYITRLVDELVMNGDAER